MSYKTIVVYVNESRHTPKRIEIAADLAMSEGAHLVGVATTALPAEFYLAGVMGDSNAGFEIYLDFLRERANTALAQFEAIAERRGVPSFEKRIAADDAAAGMSLHARYSDLVVIGQNDPDESLPGVRADFPENVVMNCGRPVLVTPYAGRFESIGKRVLIAWDASVEATRAVTAAIPLLKRADIVELAVFNPKVGFGAHGEHPGADIALYLARHGVKIEVSQVKTADGMDVGNALLSHAADFGADLMVMGGYGHSRFREVLLGGVTDTVLKSMTIPTLMAH
jgi:nucleotide-binding universal stress UspA family protein